MVNDVYVKTETFHLGADILRFRIGIFHDDEDMLAFRVIGLARGCQFNFLTFGLNTSQRFGGSLTQPRAPFTKPLRQARIVRTAQGRLAGVFHGARNIRDFGKAEGRPGPGNLVGEGLNFTEFCRSAFALQSASIGLNGGFYFRDPVA